jgi:hypothetical protein
MCGAVPLPPWGNESGAARVAHLVDRGVLDRKDHVARARDEVLADGEAVLGVECIE